MIIKSILRNEAEVLMSKTSSQNLPVLDEVHKGLRKDLEDLFNEINTESKKDDYSFDVLFGIRLYDYLKGKGFNNRGASNVGIWRYLSVAVIPHIVEKRWDRSAVDHYWRRPSRIWLSSIWWYVHLSWQGNIEDTQKLLLSPCFTTDTILNLVERTGRDGTYVDVYRRIMKYQTLVKKDAATVFRAVMKLNTAKSVVIEPALHPNGVDGYVRSIYQTLGVELT